MKRFFVLTLLLLPLGLLGAQPTGAASVFIDSDPLRAAILLDGKLLTEQTPVLLRNLPPGKHTVELWKEGFTLVSRTFVVSPEAVPVVQVALPPDSIVLAFPAHAEVFDSAGTHQTAGQQFRYPSGAYVIEDKGGQARLSPVFADEGLLTVAGWGLGIVVVSAFLSSASDIYHIRTGWVDHPSILTAGLWATALFEWPWYAALNARKARFIRDSAPTITALPQRLDLAQTLFTEGEEALQAGELDQAVGLFTKVIREHPDSQLVPGAWFRVARIHSVTGSRELALGEYRLVAEMYPQAAYHDRARQALADLFEASENPEKALANLDQMVLADGFFDKEAVAVQKARLTTALEASHAK